MIYIYELQELPMVSVIPLKKVKQIFLWHNKWKNCFLDWGNITENEKKKMTPPTTLSVIDTHCVWQNYEF